MGTTWTPKVAPSRGAVPLSCILLDPDPPWVSSVFKEHRCMKLQTVLSSLLEEPDGRQPTKAARFNRKSGDRLSAQPEPPAKERSACRTSISQQLLFVRTQKCGPDPSFWAQFTTLQWGAVSFFDWAILTLMLSFAHMPMACNPTQ